MSLTFWFFLGIVSYNFTASYNFLSLALVSGADLKIKLSIAAIYLAGSYSIGYSEFSVSNGLNDRPFLF